MEKILNVRFMDPDKNFLEVIKEERVDVIPFILEDEDVKIILEDWPVEKIEESTAHRDAHMALMEARFQEWLAIDEGIAIETGPTAPVEKFDLASIFEHEFESEDLFKLKLKIFEDEDVKGLKDRDIKSKIRKATDVLTIIGLYYQVKTNSVSDESVDETPPTTDTPVDTDD